jgi:hypothetical protein
MTITLEEIKVHHSKVAEMIAAFEKQAATTEYQVKAMTIALGAGERYAGVVLGENGEADHHLILLPGEADDINWEAACKWAAEQGGDLPNRREQSLLFANLKSEFQSSWYWSNQKHEDDNGWAWFQDFLSGGQDSYDVYVSLRARAVRRLLIQ